MADREKLIELIAKFCGCLTVNDIQPPYGFENLADYLIASGVAIPVRCKNCKSRNHDGEGNPWCDIHMMPLNDLDFFCRDGKPKAHTK